MRFIAIDVETANYDCTSICEIGWAKVKDGALIEKGTSLINPNTYFEYINTQKHGLTEEDVSGAPKFRKIWDLFIDLAEDYTITSHGPFDRTAVYRLLDKRGLTRPANPWLDIMRIIRRAWPEKFGDRGYGLANVCSSLGIPLLNHHRAGPDSLAAAQILIHTLTFTGWTIEDAIARAEARMTPKYYYAGQPIQDGPLTGHIVVFTGALSIMRGEAAEIARSLGATVGTGVTRKTTLLVVGNGESVERPEFLKTGKHLKAELLVSKGKASIQIISESDFVEIANLQ